VGCRSFGVNTILVGLHRVGLVGLEEALKKAAGSGLEGREALTALLLDTLTTENYVPEAQREALGLALWREYLRYRGEDFSEFLSEIEVTVRGEEDEAREAFVDTLGAVFREIELKPSIVFAPPAAPGPNPQLVINDEIVVRGAQSRQAFKTAVRRSITDW
jgi:hypothetical protein